MVFNENGIHDYCPKSVKIDVGQHDITIHKSDHHDTTILNGIIILDDVTICDSNEMNIALFTGQ